MSAFEILKLTIHLRGDVCFKENLFNYNGGMTKKGMVIDPDLLTWSIFDEVCQENGVSSGVEKVWYKLPHEDFSSVRVIFEEKDAGIREMCRECMTTGEVDVYLQHGISQPEPFPLSTPIGDEQEASDEEDETVKEGEHPEDDGEDPVEEGGHEDPRFQSVDAHHHTKTGKARMLKQGVNARLFRDEARRRPGLRWTDIKDEIMMRYTISVSKWICMKARRLAFDLVIETQKEQFAKLWDYEGELQRRNKDIRTEIVTIPTADGNKMMETFQGFGYSDKDDEGSRLLKKLELASKNFRESKLSVSSSSSSERRTWTTGMKKPDDPCRRCSSDSSPLVINKTCGHKFCVNCILYLWSRQKLREPCICPLDGEKMTWLRPAMLHEPEEISSLVDVYNPLFNPKTPDMLETQLEISLTWLHCVDMIFATMGSIAYYIKFCKS